MKSIETGTETIYYTRAFELISRRVGIDASYYLYDGGMSVRALTDESGVVTDTFVLDAFGNEVARTGSSDNSYGFQGEERDATGLYYLRARYMDPSTGTFTSMDTYAGSLSDPMSLHKYLFANSNPVKYCDPSGHLNIIEENCVMGIIGALSNSIVFWLDYSINDEFNPDGLDYVETLVGGFLAGFFVGVFVPGLSFVSVVTLAGAYLLLMSALMATVGFTILGIVTACNDEFNLTYEERVIAAIFEVIGEILVSPLMNVLSLGNDLYELIIEIIKTVYMDLIG